MLVIKLSEIKGQSAISRNVPLGCDLTERAKPEQTLRSSYSLKKKFLSEDELKVNRLLSL